MMIVAAANASLESVFIFSPRIADGGSSGQDG
jgi:hypothetical protein